MLSKKSLKFNFLLSLLLALLLFPSLNYAQQEERSLQPQLTRDQSLFPLQSTGIWTEVHPLIPRVDYWGVHFANADTGWAVGEGGAVIKTTNGGAKWIWYESGVENTLRTVAAVNNGNRVIAAGDGGMILISEDAGETWSALPSGTTDNIWNMQMLTEEIGWMVGEGGTALKTTDAGLNWIQQPMPYPNSSYWDVSFVNINIGYISCPSGIVIKTTNGGGDWTTQVAGDTRALWTIYAIDSLKVIAGGFAGKLVYTSNGGITWIPLWDYGISYNKITFADSLLGIGAGDGSISTTDGGLNWYLLNIHNITDNNAVFTSSGVGYMVGNSMSLLKTSNLGASWNKTILNDNLTDVHFVDELSGFFVGRLIYKTSDGALTINTVNNFPYDTMYNPYSITFTDNVNGFIGGQPTHIIKTTDAGESWSISNITGLPDLAGSVRKLFFYSKNIGWAATTRGSILKTTDGGNNWYTQINVGISVGFNGIYFIDSLNGWTANSNKRPFKTSDGGENWIEQTNLNFFQTNDVYFSDLDTGWIASSLPNGFYITADGGTTWNNIPSVVGANRFHFFPRKEHWLISGSNRYETTDNGIIWNNISNDVKSFLNYCAPVNQRGYASGSTGLILSYIDTSFIPVEIISFNTEISNDGIKLIWKTAIELNNKGFEIQKSQDKQTWTNIGFVAGRGSTTEITDYSYFDDEISDYKAFYRLKQIDFNGSFEYSQVIEVTLENLPLIFDLHQNYPNPFNAITIIKYSLPKKSFLNISLYDIKGEKVFELVNEEKEQGLYAIKFNGDKLATGIYLYRMITSSGYSSSRKLIMLK